MGTGYTRQSAADIQDGEDIVAAPLNVEFNQLESAFHFITGHAHDGTTGEGPKLVPDISFDYTNGLLPDADGTRNLGSGTAQWNSLFLDNTINFGNGDVLAAYTANALTFTGATSGYSFDDDILLPTSGSVINFNAGDVTITHAANTLSFAGASSGYKFADGPIVPTTTDTIALGTSSLMFSDLFLASGAVINWDNGDVTLTHSTNELTFSGATNGYSFSGDVKSTVDGADDLGSVTRGWASLFMSSGGLISFNSSDVTIEHSSNTLTFAGATTGYKFGDGPITPVTSDGTALGTSTLMFSDLFLASGSVVNFDNGDVTITHSANQLNFAGASNGYRFDGPVVPSANDGAALGTATFMWSDLVLASGGVINWNNNGISLREDTGVFMFAVGGTDELTLGSSTLRPVANDGLALGNGTTSWSDLFLASGGAINWDNGDVTITHSASGLTFASGSYYIFDSAVIPLTNDGAALGNTTYKWSDLFLANGSVINFNAGDVTITHASNFLQFSGATDYGFVGNIVPGANDTYNLGFNGTGEWHNVFVGSAGAYRVGTFSNTGATKGTLIDNTTYSHSVTGTGVEFAAAFYNANGLVGNIHYSGSTTTYTTSSDKTKKYNWQQFDSGSILDQLEVWKFQWKADDTYGYGVLAQDAYEVFPDAVSIFPATEESEALWMVDYSKFVPLLLQEVKELRVRVAQLESN